MVAVSIVGPKNLDYIFVHFFRKSSIIRLFETPCINAPYNKRKLMNGAITWRWAGTTMLSRLAARRRQSWLFFFCSFCSISQKRLRLEVWNFYHKMHLDGMQLLPSIHFFGIMHCFTLKNNKLKLSRIFKGDWYLLRNRP